MKRFILLAIAACVGSCIDNSGEMLQLRNAFAPVAPACTVQASDTIFRAEGTRDVSLASLASYGYLFAAQVANNAAPVTNYPLRYGNNPNILVDANDVTIDGFNVCYEFLEFRDGTQMAGLPPTTSAPSCKSAGLKTFFLSASATNLVAGGLAAVFVDLFPPGVTGVTDYFPPAPVPPTADEIAAIRAAKMIPASTTDAQISADELAAREAAYQTAVSSLLAKLGNNAFMSKLQEAPFRKTILVHIQVVGRTRDQRRVTSNEMIYNIELCAGCLTQSCALDLTSICFVGQDILGKCKT